MKIDVLSKSTVKVTMTAEDMNNYDVDFEKLSGKTAESRRMIGGLLCALQQEKRIFRPGTEISEECFCDERRFFVEAFPRMDGGCMLYISSLDGERRRRTAAADVPAILCETGAGGLFPLCRALVGAKMLGKADFSSALYRSDGVNYGGEINRCDGIYRPGGIYRLSLTPRAACLSRLEEIAGEFGTLIKGDSALAATSERFSLLIAENAAEKLAKVI